MALKRTSEVSAIEAQEMLRHKKDLQDELDVIGKGVKERLGDLLVGKELKTDLLDRVTGDILMREKKKIKQEDIDRIAIEAWAGADLKGSMDVIESLESIIDNYSTKVARLTKIFDDKIERLSIGDELAPGVIKMVKFMWR